MAALPLPPDLSTVFGDPARLLLAQEAVRGWTVERRQVSVALFDPSGERVSPNLAPADVRSAFNRFMHAPPCRLCKGSDQVERCWCGCGLDLCREHQHPWVLFTKRTEDPKLAWLERRLAEAGIPSRRDGYSFHAPILKVPEQCLDKAWAILEPVDDIPDADPQWLED
jgi:hypothetical protein